MKSGNWFRSSTPSGFDMTSDLARAIDGAWEARESLGPSTKGEARDAVEAALSGLDDGSLRVAEKVGRRMDRASMAEESRAAVLPPQRHENHFRRAGRGGVVGQGRFQIPGLGRSAFSRRRLPRRAGRDRAPLGLHRQRRGADAQLRQCRRPRGRRHHDRHLGHGRLLRPGREPTATSRAARGLAACWNPCRPRPPSSRTIALSARAPKWPKA